MEHIGDVKVRAIFDRKGNAAGKERNTQQPGKRKRRLKADERAMLERWAQQQTLDEYVLLKGLRRFGSKVRRV